MRQRDDLKLMQKILIIFGTFCQLIGYFLNSKILNIMGAISIIIGTIVYAIKK